MILVIVMLGIVILFLLLVIEFQARELRQRDEHLAWVDRRDSTLRTLWASIHVATLIPKTSILSGYMQHGMISKNAVQEAPMLLTESHKRMEHFAGVLRRISEDAKRVEHWERANPAPPVSITQHGTKREQR